MNQDSPTSPPIGVILKVWMVMVAGTVVAALFWGLAGPKLLDWIAAGDPSPENRRELDSLRTVKQAITNEDTTESPSDGISLAQCLLRAADAEKQGNRPLAELWLALDAHGRGAPEAAFSHEREALRAAGIQAAQTNEAAFEGLLPGYSNRKRELTAKTATKPSKAK